jgi:DNA-damage-inducible protein J
MIENSVIRGRIDATTKVGGFRCSGFNRAFPLSKAVRLMLKRVAAEKALPFDPLIPNAETIEDIKAAHRGEITTATSLDGLFQGLKADECSSPPQAAGS